MYIKPWPNQNSKSLGRNPPVEKCGSRWTGKRFPQFTLKVLKHAALRCVQLSYRAKSWLYNCISHHDSCTLLLTGGGGRNRTDHSRRNLPLRPSDALSSAPSKRLRPSSFERASPLCVYSNDCLNGDSSDHFLNSRRRKLHTRWR